MKNIENVLPLGQDAKEIDFLTNLIKEERKKGKTIIIVTHNIEFALKHIPRIIVMSQGIIVADGKTEKILNNQTIIDYSSMILPQISEFRIAMEEIGIKCPNDLTSEEQMVNFLSEYLKNKIKT
ncbi:MAG: hypothetical protein P8Y70_11830 [Candidatus Lokiarchaeota archaeon]